MYAYTFTLAIPLEELLELLRGREYDYVSHLLSDVETAWVYPDDEDDQDTPLTEEETAEEEEADPAPQLETVPPVIEGTGQTDYMNGLMGPAMVYGYAGNDEIDGLSGEDTILGGRGNDLLIGGLDDDTVVGGEDNDILYGGDQGDLLIGDNGTNHFFGRYPDPDDGHAGNDTIDGGQGADRIDAGSGDDLIDAGADEDIVHAGPGADVIVSRMDGNIHNNANMAFPAVRNGSDSFDFGRDRSAGGDGAADALILTGDSYVTGDDLIDFGVDRIANFEPGIDSVITGAGVSLLAPTFESQDGVDFARFPILFEDRYGNSWQAGTLEILGFEAGDLLVPDPDPTE